MNLFSSPSNLTAAEQTIQLRRYILNWYVYRLCSKLAPIFDTYKNCIATHEFLFPTRPYDLTLGTKFPLSFPDHMSSIVETKILTDLAGAKTTKNKRVKIKFLSNSWNNRAT